MFRLPNMLPAVFMMLAMLTAPAGAATNFYSGRDLAAWCADYRAYIDRYGGQNVEFQNLVGPVAANISLLFGMIDGIVSIKSGEDVPVKERLDIPSGWKVENLAAVVVEYVEQRPQEITKPASELVQEALWLQFFVRSGTSDPVPSATPEN